MSKFSLLIWMEKGKRTHEQATKSGRDQKPEWFECLMLGMFSIGENGSLRLTDAGHGELSEQRLGTG